MIEAIWMTALGFAVPAIGADTNVVVDAGYTLMKKTCSLSIGDSLMSGFSHIERGEVFVLAVALDGVVVSVDVVAGGGLHGDALFVDDGRCTEAPTILHGENTIGLEVTTLFCNNGNLNMHARGDREARGLCGFDFDVDWLETFRKMFKRGR